MPCSGPRKDLLHRYTLPKLGLDRALSAHTASLSENRTAFCLDTSTGAFQALLSPDCAAAKFCVSRRDNAMALKPLKLCSLRWVAKFDVRLA